ncbi:SDR family NAD(P)-dependent oxidoreductase [Shimia sp.]|uniref:SDR family NAD(P)-dependent oxidoreductase n=1 Tax=Shimia sp. TaxID=1954381 RepID=UPI003B8C2D85
MTKTILITGATDGIGYETAKRLVAMGHSVLVHGRNTEKLSAVKSTLDTLSKGATVKTYQADLSRFADVVRLSDELSSEQVLIDVLINNAGVLKTPNPLTESGLDVRFVVNTLAPYLLTRRLLTKLPPNGRVVNLSSAAQASVDVDAMAGHGRLADMEAYAQSKLALTIWTQEMARELHDGPILVAVNPGSLLASKMVKEGFGLAGNDLGIGADILARAALSDDFSNASGQYFDNDSRRFAPPHLDASNLKKAAEVYEAVQTLVKKYSP